MLIITIIIYSTYIIHVTIILYMYMYTCVTFFSTTALQIHFVNENHWVASSYLNGVISLYDSLPCDIPTISDGLAEQLARIYGNLESSVKESCLTIHHVPVQKQEGVSDCGLFSIAFAYHAAIGENNLEQTTFDQKKLRSHLVACLETKHFSKFPTLSHDEDMACEKSISIIPLYCHCRLPDSYDNTVACDKCNNWYHYKCVGFNSSSSCDEEWFCSNCF